MSVVVISIFEGGYQPINALSAYTALEQAGLPAVLHDIYVDGFDANDVAAKSDGIYAIAVPLFDSLSSAPDVVRQIREADPQAKIIFFGQYATINARHLAGQHCDFVINGEWEQPLVNLVRHLSGEPAEELFGVVDGEAAEWGLIGRPYRSRGHFVVPNRKAAPPLSKYPQPHLNKLLGYDVTVGGLESTRGCHHKCTYCSVYAAYDGKVILSDSDIVVQDVRNMVEMGMDHLTFIDADFFNAKKHPMRILRQLHEEFPHLTYDFTTRVDHILENREAITEMADLGVKVITSALEFPNQRVLNEVYKEMDVPMIEAAIQHVRASGITINPTFIMFNPWVDLEDLALFEDWVDRNDLAELIDPVQYETRLHLYEGSPLLKNDSIQALNKTRKEFHYEWEHPDPRVDELFLASVTPPDEQTGFKRCCLKC